MLLRESELRGVPVYTESGDKIGKLAGLTVDGEAHLVQNYVVAKSRSLSALLPVELIVRPAQVLSLDADKMVVEDSTVMAEAFEASAVQRQTNGVAAPLTRSK